MITSDAHVMAAMSIHLRKSEMSILKKAYNNLINALNVIAVAMKIDQCVYPHHLFQ
jgi:hypothetical protein